MPSSRSPNDDKKLYVNFTFSLDGKNVIAIRTEAISLSEFKDHLAMKFGSDRITNVQAKGTEKAK